MYTVNQKRDWKMVVKTIDTSVKADLDSYYDVNSDKNRNNHLFKGNAYWDDCPLIHFLLSIESYLQERLGSDSWDFKNMLRT